MNILPAVTSSHRWHQFKRYLLGTLVLLSAIFVIFYVRKVTSQNTSPISELKSNVSFEIVEKEKDSKPVRLLFVGDMSFDRYIRQVSTKKGKDFVFSCIDDFLKQYDLVVANLEGPITDNPSTSLGTAMGTPNNYVFTFPSSTAALLKEHNIRLVNTGNNHIGNFGQEGILSTRMYLEEAGVGYFGGLHGDEPVYRTNTNISFVSYNQFGGNSPEDVAVVIKKEKQQGRSVIVYAHWGEEYTTNPSRIRDVAKLFADSGADAVIGSHPHVVMPHETIGNTIVYYSLGNFIFDQYFSSQVRHGLAVEIVLAHGVITAKEYPLELEPDGRTCPLVTENSSK